MGTGVASQSGEEDDGPRSVSYTHLDVYKRQVSGNISDFQLKDVATKVEGLALDAGIPDCTSTALALVIEKINNCYEECAVSYTHLHSMNIWLKKE